MNLGGIIQFITHCKALYLIDLVNLFLNIKSISFIPNLCKGDESTFRLHTHINQFNFKIYLNFRKVKCKKQIVVEEIWQEMTLKTEKFLQ